MKRERVLVTSRLVAHLMRTALAGHDVAVLAEQPDHDAWIAENGAGLRAIVCSGMERLDAARFDLLPDLALISVMAAGMSGIDLAEAGRRGIAVTNAGDINAGDVADLAVAMLLAQSRALLAGDAWVRAGRWRESRMPPTPSVSAQRVGIVGLGHIGAAVARRLEPFGCAIRWWGRNARPEAPWPRAGSLAGLARWATILVVAVAGNDGTRGLVDRAVIEALGPGGLLVNVARGFVVDEEALKQALRTGALGAAALDVMAREPDDGSGWADVPNVLLSPHVGGATHEALAGVIHGAADNVRRLFAGKPLLRRVV